ncbi:MAG: TIGR02450 family Trp-rich protein [Myxococcota bacterium]|nr:TIGR02450 family Trp-rich protein [Myxococcota bacterium]
MNRIQKHKLLMSKWTAVAPKNREKHFLVTRIIDEDPTEFSVILEAVHSKQEYALQWTELKDDTQWRQGWR